MRGLAGLDGVVTGGTAGTGEAAGVGSGRARGVREALSRSRNADMSNKCSVGMYSFFASSCWFSVCEDEM